MPVVDPMDFSVWIEVFLDGEWHLCATYGLQEIDFDPNRALDIMHELAADRLPVSKFEQSWRMLVPAIE